MTVATLIGFLILGFLVGVLVNLLCDYLPARRHYQLARRSPFASAAPPQPSFLPPERRFWLWSGVIGAQTFDPPRRVRRIAVEIGLALAFVVIGQMYGQTEFLPFYLFYAAVFALIIVIDVEYRWILAEVVFAGVCGALAEIALVGRLSLENSLRGGLLGFAILMALYLAGIGYGALRRALSGRSVGRTVLGFGDVWAATYCGLILGGEAIGPALLYMMLGGGAAALALMVGRRFQRRRGRRVPRLAAIPYGPYVVLGAALMLYFPAAAIDLLRALIGLAR